MVLHQDPIEHKTTQCARDETDDLALAEGSAQKAYGHERTAEEYQTDERTRKGSAIQVAHWFGHVSDHEIMDKARQQANQH